MMAKRYDEMSVIAQCEYRNTVRSMSKWDVRNKLQRLAVEASQGAEYVVSYLRVVIEIADERRIPVEQWQREAATPDATAE